MLIKNRTDMLCLRFVNVGNFDCINKHIEIIDEKGYVWFGKIGVKPSLSRLENMINEGVGYIILKSPEKEYFCKYEQYSFDKPEKNMYPNYYDDKSLLGHRDFSIWFKLIEIIEVKDKSVMDKVVVKSSMQPILPVTKRSMTSLFYVMNRDEITFKS